MAFRWGSGSMILVKPKMTLQSLLARPTGLLLWRAVQDSGPVLTWKLLVSVQCAFIHIFEILPRFFQASTHHHEPNESKVNEKVSIPINNIAFSPPFFFICRNRCRNQSLNDGLSASIRRRMTSNVENSHTRPIFTSIWR